MSRVDSKQWDTFLSRFPEAHLLQTSQWGALKAHFGWKPEYLIGESCGALVLFRRLPLGYSIAYIPKGPVGRDFDSILPELNSLCRQHKAIFLKIEPDEWENTEQGDYFKSKKWIPTEPVQPRRTILIDLNGNENDWLDRMKQKTRYNIRLAERKEIVVQSSDNVAIFYDLMMSTGQRDEFGIHSKAYYETVLHHFSETGNVKLFIAYYHEEPLAGLMAFSRGKRAWYFYGASNEKERNRMPTYLLQWEAMKWAASLGCSEYDLWGIPDEDEDQLEKNFSERSDGLWGVYRFKRGFGGVIRRSASAWDKVYHPVLYKAYQIFLRFRKGEAAG